MRQTVWGIILLFIGLNAYSQENHFSQFYNAPQYLNPAFAGDAHYMRTGVSTRYMKPLPTKPVINSLLHYDYKVINQNNGIGFTIFSHTEVLTHLKLQLNYSHTIKLSHNNYAKGGLGISINQRSSNADNLTFPDQYDILGYTGSPSAEPLLKDNSYFPGLSAGAVFYNEALWISLSGDYLNLPRENFAGQNNTYPMKFIFATGLLYPLNKKNSSKRRFSKFGGLKPYSSLGPVICFVQHGKFTEISGGVSATIQPFYGGIHYRYQHDFNIDNTKYAYKAFVLIAGYRQEEFAVAYSVDLSFSNQTVNRNGAHEFSFTWYFSTRKEDYKRNALIPLNNQLLY